MYTGFDLEKDAQKDNIHPNASGEIKMAQHWFDALMRKGILGD